MQGLEGLLKQGGERDDVGSGAAANAGSAITRRGSMGSPAVQWAHMARMPSS